MEFRNFDKIGLKTQYEIRRFLGEGIIGMLERDEYTTNLFVNEALHNHTQEKYRYIVGLISKDSQEGIPVLSLIRATTYRKQVHYLFSVLELIADKDYYEASYGVIRKDINKLIALSDSVYGATSKWEILEKARPLQYEDEDE